MNLEELENLAYYGQCICGRKLELTENGWQSIVIDMNNQIQEIICRHGICIDLRKEKQDQIEGEKK